MVGREDETSSAGQNRARKRRARGGSGLLDTGVMPIKRTSLSTKVSEAIVEGLLDGRLSPGDRLVESDLADLLGISRSPVREALTELALSGVVAREPGRGCRIREWTKKDLADLFGVRSQLEGYAARLAATQVTPDFKKTAEKIIARMAKAARKNDYLAMINLDMAFHEAIWELSGNLLLRRVLDDLSPQFRLFLTLNWKFHGGLDEVADNHQRLLDSLMSGDEQKAESAIFDHVVVEKMVSSVKGADYDMRA